MVLRLSLWEPAWWSQWPCVRSWQRSILGLLVVILILVEPGSNILLERDVYRCLQALSGLSYFCCIPGWRSKHLPEQAIHAKCIILCHKFHDSTHRTFKQTNKQTNKQTDKQTNKLKMVDSSTNLSLGLCNCYHYPMSNTGTWSTRK